MAPHAAMYSSPWSPQSTRVGSPANFIPWYRYGTENTNPDFAELYWEERKRSSHCDAHNILLVFSSKSCWNPFWFNLTSKTCRSIVWVIPPATISTFPRLKFSNTVWKESSMYSKFLGSPVAAAATAAHFRTIEEPKGKICVRSMKLHATQHAM